MTTCTYGFQQGSMAVTSSDAGTVLARKVFMIVFGTSQTDKCNTFNNVKMQMIATTQLVCATL